MQDTESECRCCVPPTLYYDEISPQSRSCYMLIELLDIEVKLQQISVIKGENLSDSFRKINPCGTIPTLIDGQFILSDGHTIMMYLCDKYAGIYLPHLCPRDYLPRLKVLNMLFYEGCVLYRRYIHLVTEILLRKYPNVDMSYHQAKVIDSYNSLEANLKCQACMTGNCLTIADLSIVTTLSSLDLMFHISQDQWPNLHRWFDNLKTMDCYKCNDAGLQKLSHLLEKEGQFPLSAMRSSLHSTVDIHKEIVNSSTLKEPEKFPLNERSSLSEKETAEENDGVDKESVNLSTLKEYKEYSLNERISRSEVDTAEDNDGIPTNEILSTSHAPSNEDSFQALNEDETDTQFSKFLPKIRTSKIIVSPSHTDHEVESSQELKQLYEKPADKALRDSEVESTRSVEDSKRVWNISNRASDCLCCRRSDILKNSKIEWICRDCIQKNQRVLSVVCNNSEKSNRMKEPNQCTCSVGSKLNDTLEITCSPKHPVSQQNINKAKCVEFECRVKNQNESQHYADSGILCPCCQCASDCACAYDEGELREFRSCMCIENIDNCDPSCPCALRVSGRQREWKALEMEDPCTEEFDYSDNEADDVANQECNIDCKCQEDIREENSEIYEDDDEDDNCDCDCDADAEFTEDSFVCCCATEDANNDNRFQEVFCCCDEDKKEEFCCFDQNPLEDETICCCGGERQNCNIKSSGLMECCYEGVISKPSGSDKTSHITICLFDGHPAKPVPVCCNDNRQSIEDSSNDTIACCCQDTDTSNNSEHDYQDTESYDCCDTKCPECSFTDGNGKGHSENQRISQSYRRTKHTTSGFREKALQNRAGRCCCIPYINCQERLKTANKICCCKDDSDLIHYCARKSELPPAFRDNKRNIDFDRHCTCSTSTSGAKPIPNRECVVQKKATQYDDRQDTSNKCSCSAGIVDMEDWNISQPRIEDRNGGSYKHETLDQERRSFGSIKASQQKLPPKGTHKANNDKENTNVKTLFGSSKDRSSLGKSFDKIESMHYEGYKRMSDISTKAKMYPVSGTSEGSLEESHKNSGILAIHPSKSQASTPPKESLALQKKDISKEPKPDQLLKPNQTLSKISDIKNSNKYGPKAKTEDGDKIKKRDTESSIDAKIKRDDKEYQPISKSSANKNPKVGDKTNRTEDRIRPKKDENGKTNKNGKTGDSETGSTDHRVGGEDSKTNNKTNEDVAGITDKDEEKHQDSNIAGHHKLVQDSGALASEPNNTDSHIDDTGSKSGNNTTEDVAGTGDKAPTALGTGKENEVPESEDKESRNENGVKEMAKTKSANNQRLKQQASQAANEQRTSEASRTLAAETNNKTPDRNTKQKGKQPTEKSTNERRASQRSSDKRGSKDKNNAKDRDKINEIIKRTEALCQPFNLVQIKCTKRTNKPRISLANCDTLPRNTFQNAQDHDNCLQCQTKCFCHLPVETAYTTSCPVFECNNEQFSLCPHQNTQFQCEEQRTSGGKSTKLEVQQFDCEISAICESNAEQCGMFKCGEHHPCESSRAQQTNCQPQSSCCSKVNPTCFTSFHVGNCVIDSPCVGRLHANQHDRHSLCEKPAVKPTNCCLAGNKDNKTRTTGPKKITCCPQKSKRKSQRLTAGGSDCKTQSLENGCCGEESKPILKKNIHTLQEKELQSYQQSFFGQDTQDSTSNISQEEITSIRHFYNWDDMKGEQLKASESKRRGIKKSKIPRLVLPKVYLVYRESHDIPHSQKHKEFCKLPTMKFYGGQDYHKENQEKPLRYSTYQEPKCTQEIIKKCCRTNPSRIPQLDRNGLGERRKSETAPNATGLSTSHIPSIRNKLLAYNSDAKTNPESSTCTICEKYLQPKTNSSQFSENFPEKTLSDESLKSLQTKLSRSQSKNRESICITKVECCNSNGRLIKKVSRVITTSIRRESPSYARDLDTSLSSLISACNTALKAVNVERKEENEPTSIARENKELKGVIRECKCCHCREDQIGNLRGRDKGGYETQMHRNLSAERTIFSNKQGQYQNKPSRQDHQSLTAVGMKNTDTRIHRSEHQSTQDLPNIGKRRQYQRQRHQVDNNRSNIRSSLGQARHCPKSQDKVNAPPECRFCKPKEFYCYPSSHRDGSMNTSKPGFTLEDSNRIRGGLTDQFGKEIKSDTFLRENGCSCTKSVPKKRCATKQTNRDQANDNECCNCDLTAVKDKSSTQTEPSRLSKLINGPRRTLPNPAASDVSQFKESVIPKAPNPDETDTLSRSYGCSCTKASEKKICYKCKGKRSTLAPVKTQHKEHDYCDCEPTVDEDVKCTKLEHEKHNRNPVILNVSIKTCSEDKDNTRCRSCRAKKTTLCDNMIELSCTCCCGENERYMMNENNDSSESHKDITVHNIQSPEKDTQTGSRLMSTQHVVPGKDTTESDTETTQRVESNVQRSSASQAEDLPLSEKRKTARNDQPLKDDSRNMKLGQKESKFIPAKHNVQGTPTITSNKEATRRSKKGAPSAQRGSAMERQGRQMKTKAVSDKLQDLPDNDPLLTDVENNSANLDVFQEIQNDISQMDKHQEQSKNRENSISPKETTVQVVRCMCGRTIPCPYTETMVTMKCLEIAVEKCCRSKKCNEDDESKVKETIESLVKSPDGSQTSLEPTNGTIQTVDPKQSDSNEIETTKSSVTKKSDSKTINPTKVNKNEIKDGLNAVSKGEDDQSEVKETIESLKNSADQSHTSLEPTNAPRQKEEPKKTDSNKIETTKVSVTKKGNSKAVDKIPKNPTKPNGKEIKEDLNAASKKSRKSTDANGNVKKEELPVTNKVIKKSMEMNGKLNIPQSSARNSNASKSKVKTDISAKNNKTKPGRSSKDESEKQKTNVRESELRNQEFSKISKESVTKEPTSTKPNRKSESSSLEPTEEGEHTTSPLMDKEAHHNSQELPENLCGMSDEAFMKDFDPDDTNLPGSCDVMVVTKRRHFLNRNGAEKIEEKRLVITKSSFTDLGNYSHVGIPDPDTEIIKKCKRIGDKVCTITMTKGNKVKKGSDDKN